MKLEHKSASPLVKFSIVFMVFELRGYGLGGLNLASMQGDIIFIHQKPGIQEKKERNNWVMLGSGNPRVWV